METGIYIHVPFCVKKCAYCDFLSFPGDADAEGLYVSALIREIRASAGALKGREITTCYMGGGTPSSLSARYLRSIFDAVFDSFDIARGAEVTIEMNPGTVNPQLLTAVYPYVNRVSLGAQSFIDSELMSLGRIHRASDIEKSVSLIREYGIGNINLDLMYGIPGQTPASFRRSIGEAVSLAPEHISAYSLIVEEGTPFYKMNELGKLDLPDEEAEREMDADAGRLLAEAGYERYEISNYARPGFESRHNSNCWRRMDYLGVGLGASALLDHTRWKNTDVMEEYLEKSARPPELMRDVTRLDKRAEIEEFMFLGLRMRSGVSAADFREAFGVEMKDIYGEVITGLVGEGLLSFEDEKRCALTGRGRDVSNKVLAEFLFEEA